MILFGQKLLDHVLNEYVAQYHAERNHQGLDNVIPVIPFPAQRLGPTKGKIVKAERLGGLLHFYYRQAA